jgi:hypothetical protein
MGIEQVELLPGSQAAKRRLAVLLANVAGEMSVEEACRALGLRKSRFFELRKQWLQDSMQALEPEPPGRPVGSIGEVNEIEENWSTDAETGSFSENRPPRLASDASAEVGPTPDTSGKGGVEALSRIAELEDLLAQTRWELRTSRLREELTVLGLSRPKRVRPAQKKTRLPRGQDHGERGGAR